LEGISQAGVTAYVVLAETSQAALKAVWGQIRLGRIQILAKLAYRFTLSLFAK
jgi:hypothetical protein